MTPRRETRGGPPLFELPSTEYAPIIESRLPEAALDETRIRVIVRGDIVEAFVADAVCFSYRLPSREAGSVAFFVEDGSASA